MSKGYSFTEMDYITNFVSNMEKTTLIGELYIKKLPTDGTSEELKERLLEYYQDNPSEVDGLTKNIGEMSISNQAYSGNTSCKEF